LKSPGYPDEAPTGNFGAHRRGLPRWHTQIWSPLIEAQWHVADKWTTFVGARIDKHSYTDYLFSPRFALIHTPTMKDTLKLMFTRSNRLNDYQALKLEHDAGGADSEAEVVDNFEFRYERMHTEKLFAALTAFYQETGIIGFGGPEFQSKNLAEMKLYGGELELSYRRERFQMSLSHQYTKLQNFDLRPDVPNTFVTAAPFGFGDDLADWSNHNTKVIASYFLNDIWRVHGNLNYLWGFPGMQDYVEREYARRGADAAYVDLGWDKLSERSVFLNLGIEYKPSDNCIVNLVGYHLLGLLDEDLNKQNYLGGRGGYRNLAPSIGLDISWMF
jgi:outer membrane receptor protein involved in Fe transport